MAAKGKNKLKEAHNLWEGMLVIRRDPMALDVYRQELTKLGVKRGGKPVSDMSDEEVVEAVTALMRALVNTLSTVTTALRGVSAKMGATTTALHRMHTTLASLGNGDVAER